MKHIYTGLMKLHPEAGKSVDGFVDHDKTLIKKSIENIIRTHKGSRVYDPNYGTNLHDLIHEHNIQRTRNIAKNEIIDAITKYEPRVKILNLDIYPRGQQETELIVVMTLLYIEYGEEEIFELKLFNDERWEG